MRAVKGEHAVCVSLCGLACYGAGYSSFSVSTGLVQEALMVFMKFLNIMV